MFSKLRPLNGLVFNIARRTFYSGYPPITSNGCRSVDLLKTAKTYRQERSESTIHVNQTKDLFYIDVHGRRAELVYKIHEQVMTITQTKVPQDLAGHGLGKILAKSALDFALLNGYFIRIKCSFVMHYIDKYEPQYAQYLM